MGIRFPAENAAYFETLRKGLSELAAAGALHALPGFGSGSLSAGAGHPVYAVSSRSAAGRDPVDAAEIVAWRYVLFRGEEAVGTAEVGPTGDNGQLGVMKVQQGPLAGRIIEAIRAAEARDDLAGCVVEARALCIPELAIEALWLRNGTSDSFVALGGDSTDTLAREGILGRWYERFPAAPDGLRTIAGRAALPAVLAPRPLAGEGRTMSTTLDVGDPPKTKVLNFLIQQQQQNMWCWLAVSSSIFQFYNGGNPDPWSQCALANSCLTRVNCCGNPGSCNSPGSTELAMQTASVWSSTMSDATPTLLKIETVIDAGQPIATSVLAAGNVGHAQVIFGYTEPGVIYIADPWPGVGEFAANYRDYPGGGGLWRKTFFSKKP